MTGTGTDTGTGTGTGKDRPRRRYDSQLRRQRAEETRGRMVSAGAELLRNASVRDWDGVTIRAVAERAGVNERTVYRHFASERALRDAVIHHLEQGAGIDFTTMRMDDVADVTARVLRLVSTHPAPAPPQIDPTLAEASRRRQEALFRAVSDRAPAWPPADRRMAAAILDIQWAASSYERLLLDWDLAPDEAIHALTWVIGLVRDAVEDGRTPRPQPPAD